MQTAFWFCRATSTTAIKLNLYHQTTQEWVMMQSNLLARLVPGRTFAEGCSNLRQRTSDIYFLIMSSGRIREEKQVSGSLGWEPKCRRYCRLLFQYCLSYSFVWMCFPCNELVAVYRSNSIILFQFHVTHGVFDISQLTHLLVQYIEIWLIKNWWCSARGH